MINKSIINAILNAAKPYSKDAVIKELLNHFSITYDYEDAKSNHILEMLVDDEAIINFNKLNFSFITENINKFIYKCEDYNIRNITIKEIDNIDCIVKVSYDYIEKINEDRDDISYKTGCININFIENPNILKK